MVASAVQVAKRALVSLLLALAHQYGVCVKVTRESPDPLVEKAFRCIIKKVHPDKGGLCGTRSAVATSAGGMANGEREEGPWWPTSPSFRYVFGRQEGDRPPRVSDSFRCSAVDVPWRAAGSISSFLDFCS